jgi:very-short-patch-repair endonuclease
MNERLFNNQIFRDRRKELRINQTDAEKKLWYCICNRQLGGHKFYRQYSVGPYILDFYCPKYKLAIELDGSQHTEEDAVLYDKDRNKYLETVGIKTIRFWNNDVLGNTKNVLEAILAMIPVSPLKIRGD